MIRWGFTSRLRHHLATAACDLLFFLCGNNPDLLRSEAEKLEALCSCGPDALAVLSDATCEHKKVDTAKKSDVCANYFAYGKSKDIQRERRMRIVGAGTFFQRANI